MAALAHLHNLIAPSGVAMGATVSGRDGIELVADEGHISDTLHISARVVGGSKPIHYQGADAAGADFGNTGGKAAKPGTDRRRDLCALSFG